MRQISILMIIGLSISCTTTRKASSDTFALNGTWTPIKQEMAGNALPASVLATEKLVLADSVYTFSAESIDKGTLTYSNGKMDIYGKKGVNSGKHFSAIYKMENGELTICYNLSGGSYPESFETKGKPGLFLSVFKKSS